MFFSVAFFSHGQRRALQLAFNITVYSSKYLVFLYISAMLKKVYGTINPYEIDPKLSSCKLFFQHVTAISVLYLGVYLLEATQLVLCSI